MEIIKGLILVILIALLVFSCALPQQAKEYRLVIEADESSAVFVYVTVSGIESIADLKSDKKTDIRTQADVSVIPKKK